MLTELSIGRIHQHPHTITTLFTLHKVYRFESFFVMLLMVMCSVVLAQLIRLRGLQQCGGVDNLSMASCCYLPPPPCSI
jgi:hypothetical protein